jgi:hypothetical protein
MTILLALTVAAGVGICFGAFLFVIACVILQSPLPFVSLFFGSYMVVWKLDKDDEKRMGVKYKLRRRVKK